LIITSVVMVILAEWLLCSARSYPIRLKAMMVAEAVTFAFVIVGMVAFVAGEAMDRAQRAHHGWGIASCCLSLPGLVRHRAAHRMRPSSDAPSRAARAVRVVRPGAKVRAGDRRRQLHQFGYLPPKLLADGYRVRGADLFLYGTNPIASVLDHPELQIVRADFRRVDALVAGMQGVDHLVHLGGIVGDPACAIDEDLTIDVNLAATRLIGEVAKGNGIKHFVFASTCSVYGAADDLLTENSALNPLSLYARSKVASEKLLLEMADDRFTPIIVRFGTIHGLSGRTRFDLVVNLLSAKAVFEDCITVFGGDQWRPFLHVDELPTVAQLLCLLPDAAGYSMSVPTQRTTPSLRWARSSNDRLRQVCLGICRPRSTGLSRKFHESTG
jgi:nucleoside-diphosphate-sugar epimerase